MSSWERVRLRIETKQDSNKGPALKMVNNRTLSTHVLDTTTGQAATNIPVIVYQLLNGGWTQVGVSATDGDGRVAQLVSKENFQSGQYKLRFEVQTYFEKRQTSSFYPFIEIAFNCDREQHYHVPVLLSPFGYTTYRGT